MFRAALGQLIFWLQGIRYLVHDYLFAYLVHIRPVRNMIRRREFLPNGKQHNTNTVRQRCTYHIPTVTWYQGIHDAYGCLLHPCTPQTYTSTPRCTAAHLNPFVSPSHCPGPSLLATAVEYLFRVEQPQSSRTRAAIGPCSKTYAQPIRRCGQLHTG